MSETPTDRVELTDAEREAIEHAWIISPQDGPAGDDDPMYRAVESIVAARVQEYAEKFESLSDRAKNAATELGGKNDRLAAELAAANARCAELEASAQQEHDWQKKRTDEFTGTLSNVVASSEAELILLRDQNAALQATLDRVTAVLGTPDGHREWHNQGRSGVCQVVDVSRLRAALTPEGKP